MNNPCAHVRCEITASVVLWEVSRCTAAMAHKTSRAGPKAKADTRTEPSKWLTSEPLQARIDCWSSQARMIKAVSVRASLLTLQAQCRQVPCCADVVTPRIVAQLAG